MTKKYHRGPLLADEILAALPRNTAKTIEDAGMCFAIKCLQFGAERFFVKREVVDVLERMIDRKNLDDSLRAIVNTTIIPSECGWVELEVNRANPTPRWPMCWSLDNTTLHVSFLCASNGTLTCSGFVKADTGDLLDCEIAMPKKIASKELESAVFSAYTVLLRLWAFLATPKTCEIKTVVAPEKLQKARRSRGKLPLLSFKEIDFLPYRELRDSDFCDNNDENPGVRLHWVIAHWRRIIREGKPVLVPVKGHQRGNPALGVIVKNRIVA